MEINKVLESTKSVVDQSKFVTIQKGKISELCKKFPHHHVEHCKHWLMDAPVNIGALEKRDRLHFLFVFNALSFCYWGNPKWTIEYQGKKYDGAWAMIACLGRARENGINILDANYFSRISKADFQRVLHGNVQIPLFDERFKILKEVGKVLHEQFEGNIEALIAEGNQDVMKLLDVIIKNFPSFSDVASYRGRTIYFYKRAQLLIGDIFQAFKGEGPGTFRNTGLLTACADYKLPQVLRREGILMYNKELASDIDNKKEIQKESEKEVEIRANTIWAIEFIKEELRKRIPNIESIHVNDHLWLLGQQKSPEYKPYHVTRTTSY